MEPELTDWFDDSDFLDTFSPQLNYDGTPLDWKNAYPNVMTATNETAIALANKGMDVRFVYGLDACHTDSKVQLEQRVPALIWAMAPWKEKLAAKKSA
jgi:hypothetical protein